MNQTIKHFSQATSTPLPLEGSIVHFPRTIHPWGLMKTPVPDTTNGLKKYFLRELNTPEISTAITPEDFQPGINKWKEKTSTSLLGRHLGHYHAQILPPMPEEPSDICYQFLYVHTGLLNLAIKHQVVLNRWEQVDFLCIPKDSGVPKINRLNLPGMQRITTSCLKTTRAKDSYVV